MTGNGRERLAGPRATSRSVPECFRVSAPMCFWYMVAAYSGSDDQGLVRESRSYQSSPATGMIPTTGTTGWSQHGTSHPIQPSCGRPTHLHQVAENAGCVPCPLPSTEQLPASHPPSPLGLTPTQLVPDLTTSPAGSLTPLHRFLALRVAPRVEKSRPRVCNSPTHLHQVVEDAQAVRVLAVLHLQPQDDTGTACELQFTYTMSRPPCSSGSVLLRTCQLVSCNYIVDYILCSGHYVPESLLLCTCNHKYIPAARCPAWWR